MFLQCIMIRDMEIVSMLHPRCFCKILQTVSSHRLTLLPPKSVNDTLDSQTSDALINMNNEVLSGMTQLFTMAGVYKVQ